MSVVNQACRDFPDTSSNIKSSRLVCTIQVIKFSPNSINPLLYTHIKTETISIHQRSLTLKYLCLIVTIITISSQLDHIHIGKLTNKNSIKFENCYTLLILISIAKWSMFIFLSNFQLSIKSFAKQVKNSATNSYKVSILGTVTRTWLKYKQDAQTKM